MMYKTPEQLEFFFIDGNRDPTLVKPWEKWDNLHRWKRNLKYTEHLDSKSRGGAYLTAKQEIEYQSRVAMVEEWNGYKWEWRVYKAGPNDITQDKGSCTSFKEAKEEADKALIKLGYKLE